MQRQRSALTGAWLLGAAFPLAVLALTYVADPLGAPQRATASEQGTDTEGTDSTTSRKAHPDAAEALEVITSYAFDEAAKNPFRYRDGELYNTSVSVTDNGTLMISSEFQVTSILGGSSPIALINGRAYKAGDEVINGWRVEAIDPTQRYVTLRHPDGRTERATLDARNR
ncbi:MAG: hypothetical protein ACYTF7_04830 [Planctomycetota bacterium]|jgi:hypothetical protein